jgi:hypothetical protein
VDSSSHWLAGAKLSRLMSEMPLITVWLILTTPRYPGKAIRIGSSFVQEAAQRHERFLAVAYGPSHKTLEWLAYNSSGTHYVRTLGVFDGIAVLEFIPRAQADGVGVVGAQCRTGTTRSLP